MFNSCMCCCCRCSWSFFFSCIVFNTLVFSVTVPQLCRCSFRHTIMLIELRSQTEGITISLTVMHELKLCCNSPTWTGNKCNSINQTKNNTLWTALQIGKRAAFIERAKKPFIPKRNGNRRQSTHDYEYVCWFNFDQFMNMRTCCTYSTSITVNF